MDDQLPGKLLQRPQSTDTDLMDFQFMPGPMSGKGKTSQGAASSLEANLKSADQTRPGPTAESLMPPPRTPAQGSRYPGREIVRSWERQSMFHALMGCPIP